MNRISKRQALILSFLSLIVVALAICHHSLICYGMKFYIASHLSKGETLVVDYDSGNWEEGAFVLHQVSLSRASTGKSTGFDIKIKALRFVFSMQLFPFHFRSQLIIDSPEIVLLDAMQEDWRKQEGFYSVCDQYLFKDKILLNHGKIAFQQAKQAEAYFSIETKQGTNRNGVLLLAGTEEALKQAPLQVHFSNQMHDLNFDIQFDALDLPWVFSIARFFSLPIDPAIQLSRGTLSGQLAFSLSPENHISHIQYDFKLGEFSLRHTQYGMVFDAYQINWKEPVTSNEERDKWSSHPLLKKIWPYFIGEGEFFRTNIAFEDPITGSNQGIIELQGKVQLSCGSQPFADFSGIFIKEGRKYPLRLVGEGYMENDQSWKLIMDLSLHEEGGEKMTSSMALTSQCPKEYLFEGHFQNIGYDPVDLIQRLVKTKCPQLAPYVVETGRFGGSVEGLIKEFRFQFLDVKAIEVEGILVQDREHTLCFSAEKIKGKGEFDFSTADFFDGTFWELKIENGVFTGFDNTQVTNLTAELAMHDQYMKPSVISGWVNGIESSMHLEGLYTHLNLNLDFSPTAKDLLCLLGQETKDKSSQFDEKLDLDFNLHFQLIREQLAVEGSLDITRMYQPVDTVIFGAKWNVTELTNLGFLKGISLGWFKTDSLSAHVVNLPLEFFKENWRVEGRLALEGTLNKERIALSLDPSELCYTSPYIYLDAGFGEEKAPSCNFCYEFESQSWSGKIPLEKAKLIDKTFGIEFESISGELEIEDVIFKFQQISAETQGASFKGAITLDYQYGSYAELCISTDQINGSIEAIQKFLRHFSPFAAIDLPFGGELSSGKGGMSLRAYVGGREEMLKWEVCMTLQNGTYPITPTCSFEGLKTRFEWSWHDQVLRLIDSDGYLRLGGAGIPKHYQLNVPVACADFKHGKWNYDLRLETPTHDICRLVGEAMQDKEKEELQINIDPELTRFFGAQVDFRKFSIKNTGELSCLDFETDLSSRDLYHHLDFLVHAGLLPMKASMLEEMQSPRFEGETHLKVYFNQANEIFSFEAKSNHFAFGTIDLEKLLIHAERRGDEFKLNHFSAGPLAMTAHMVKEKEVWKIPTFYIDWKSCKLRGEDGLFHKQKGKVRLPLKHFNVDLYELLKLIPNLSECDLSYFTGKIATSGNIECAFSEGLKSWNIDAQLQLIGQDFGKGNLRVESAKPLHLHFSQEKGFEIGESIFNFFHPSSNQLWAKCELNALSYKNSTKTWQGKDVKVIVPPEMLHHLGAMRAFPYLKASKGYLSFFDQTFKWDNQMELSFDFTLGSTAEVQGRLKEGYYWIGDRAWYLNDFCYHLNGGDIDLKLNTLLDDHPFDLHAEVRLLPYLKTRITVQETIIEEQVTSPPLTIVSNWNENEGFFIQSIEGSVNGLDFSFHHNPKRSFLDQMVLTGQLKIDVPTLAKCLPKSIQETIREFEIGKGYELSGDCIISKEDLFNSHFTGYLKGKRFQLMGSEMETLLSEITIHTDHIELSKFNLSDVSGIFSIDDIRLTQMKDRKWKVSIPHIMVQDFRPSLLKKIGRYQGRIKPLNIRDMSFYNIRGILGDTKSFTGKGSLNFTNTFKSDYNILDIPFEILGRLGLDMGLLVPVRGKLDYVMADGKIYLTQLTDSYSEGKRSKFYLSPSEPSFIDLDGSININIKMKQYVLLKITEPFTLSIGGTFEDIHYSLK